MIEGMAGLISVFGKPIVSTLTSAAGAVIAARFTAGLEDGETQAQIGQAVVDAFQDWLVALVEDVEDSAPDHERLRSVLPDYLRSVETYLRDAEVSGELLRPFVEAVPDPKLDGALLQRRWHELNLPDLPAQFDADRACRRYVEALNRRRQAIEALRPLWTAQADQRRNMLLEAIRGRWADWNLDRYAEAMRVRYQTLDVTSLALPGRDHPDDEPIRVKDIFIPQHARRSRPARLLPRDYLDERRAREPLEEPAEKSEDLNEDRQTTRWESTPREPVLDLFTAGDVRHLVILGDPGAGKSCLARFLTLGLLEGFGGIPASEGDPPTWRVMLSGHLPSLIELRHYVDWAHRSGSTGEFLGYLHHLGCDRGFGLNRQDLDRHLREAPSLVIFDGLDEVIDPKVREDVAEAITGFARTYDQSRVVVTSRIAGFDAQPFLFRAVGFSLATLDDLDLKQIERFSRTWFSLALKKDAEEAAARHAHVMRSVRDRPPLRTLAGNPLLLTVIALIARRQELPAARTQLYEHALEIFCHQLDFHDKKLVPRDSLLKELDGPEKLHLLRRVAWTMVEAGDLRANAIDGERLKQTVATYFADEWWHDDPAKCRVAARKVIRVLEDRNYVLCQQGGGLFGFIHRTFLEFLCATQILWRIEKQRDMTVDEAIDTYVLPNAEDDGWHEIIRLLAAQLQREDARRLIAALIRQPFRRWRGREEETCPALRLGIACLGERPRREHHRFAELIETLADLAQNDRDPLVRAGVIRSMGLHLAGDRVRRLLLYCWDTDGSPRANWAIVSAMSTAAIVDGELRQLLLDAAVGKGRVDRASAIRALRPLGASDPDLRNMLINRAIYDDDRHFRHQAIRALGPLGAGDPDLRSLLIKRADGDDDPGVRGSAIQALGPLAATDPDLRNLLIHRATNDDDVRVRHQAIQALGPLAASDPDLRNQLVNCAINDGNSTVRGSAIQALGPLAATDPDLRNLLIHRATNDDDGHVRFSAIGVLGPLAARDSDLRNLLVNCAINDGNSTVRGSAIQALGPLAAGDPDLRNLLIHRATNDEDGYVRDAAIQALEPLAADDLDLRNLLIDCTTEDDYRRVRKTAIRALGSLAAADPDLRNLLIDRTTNDDDGSVRDAAIQALGPLAATDPDLRNLLIHRATNDDDGHVRFSAIRVLGPLAAIDPDLRNLLINRATDDDDGRVRSQSIQMLDPLAATDLDLRNLLIDRATNDDNEPVREAAIAALGRESEGDATLRALTVGWAAEPQDALRRAAVGAWCGLFGDRVAGALLSRHLDGEEPWIDPQEPVDITRLGRAAKRLSMTEDEVRAAYERLAGELPLTLTWRPD